MNIPPTMVLVLGITAGFLFATVFVVSLAITMRNRRIIQNSGSKSADKREPGSQTRR